ncbi:hypothetical protein NDU88_002176 [Pleurodeles waltl]|uniref:Uncharacterized protein n=1 Tax=Pleurodeles waltl TaxID=8319 RepID=A0AAV7VYK7_PLEWA|nr:hypothetical protein NDU88_002176 [Pleurodeles waltl]
MRLSAGDGSGVQPTIRLLQTLHSSQFAAHGAAMRQRLLRRDTRRETHYAVPLPFPRVSKSSRKKRTMI